MKKILVLFSLILSLGACGAQTNKTIYINPDKSELDFSESAGVVQAVYKGATMLSGTAFAYDKDHLFTAAHVCLGAAKLQVLVTKQRSLELEYYNKRKEKFITIKGIRIENISTTEDLCMLKRKNHGLKPTLLLKNYNEVKHRDKVTIVGSPAGIGVGEFNGKIITTRLNHRHPMLSNRLIVTAASTGGVSGSPVFDKYGRVIGMLVAGLAGFDHLSICVPVYKMHIFLKEFGYK